MKFFGSGTTSAKKTNDGGLSQMLEQRKFSVISQVILQDPGVAQELLSQEGVLFTFLKHEAPGDLMSIVTSVVDEKAFMERDAKGRTPLHVAAQNGCSREIISALTIKKAAKAKDKNGRVPLHYAVSNKLGNDIIKSLLRVAPAAVNEEDETGSTPLELAGKMDSKLVDLLQDASSTMSSSTMKKSGSRNTLRDESERSRRSHTGSGHRRDKFDGDSENFSSSSFSSRDFKGSKEFSKASSPSKVGRSASHESLDKRLLGLPKSNRSRSMKIDVPALIDPAGSKAVNFYDSLSTIGTGWEKPALPLTGVEYVERLAQRANS